MCTLCKQEEESRNHLFFDCSYSKEVWRIVLSLSGLHRVVLYWQREFTCTAQRLRGKAFISKILMIVWNACIYHIWKERNNRIFKQKKESPEQILEYIKVSIRLRLAGLKSVVVDTVNVSLCNSWCLFDSIFV